MRKRSEWRGCYYISKWRSSTENGWKQLQPYGAMASVERNRCWLCVSSRKSKDGGKEHGRVINLCLLPPSQNLSSAYATLKVILMWPNIATVASMGLQTNQLEKTDWTDCIPSMSGGKGWYWVCSKDWIVPGCHLVSKSSDLHPAGDRAAGQPELSLGAAISAGDQRRCKTKCARYPKFGFMNNLTITQN